ncbi:MAG: hypothetical protein ACXVQJ_04125 [Actinomycetota bacterium]
MATGTHAAAQPRKPSRSIASLAGALVVLVAIVGLYQSVSGYAGTPASAPVPAAAAAPAPSLPSVLGEQTLAWRLHGADALAQIESLHIGRFPLSSAEVARYGDATAVWVATPRGIGAEASVARMVRAIAAGGSPFASPRRDPAHAGVFTTTGAGQTHAFFAADGRVWWVAADVGDEPVALAALLEEALS